MIPEDLITHHLDMLLSSQPGDEVSMLHIVSMPASAFDSRGIVVKEKLDTAVYAVAATDVADVEEAAMRVIYRARAEHVNNNKVILFAALGQEVWMVKREVPDDLPPYVQVPDSLHDQPDAQEATLVYAACRDGRRWRAKHILTGPGAGPQCDVELLVGRPDDQEAFGGAWGRTLRRIVGQPQ